MRGCASAEAAAAAAVDGWKLELVVVAVVVAERRFAV